MIPTLDELITQLSQDVRGRDAIRLVCLQIASGQRDPEENPPPPAVIQLGCQALSILFHHIDQLPVGPELRQPVRDGFETCEVRSSRETGSTPASG